jgi:hypothetical protein
LQNEASFDPVFSQSDSAATAERPVFVPAAEKSVENQTPSEETKVTLPPRKAVRRIVSFFAILMILTFITDGVITSGLRRIKTSAFGASNQIMHGKVNAQIVITGSSRATAHYDPRIIEAVTGRSAFNLGRNGSQSDMQVAFLKAYLAHNQKPLVVIHNLDAFSFQTTREVYDPVEYTPYLYDRELYNALHKIDPKIWKTRYVPLYGYVVEDMKFTWTLGLRGFFGWSPPEDYFRGFNPRSKKWSDDFEHLKANNPNGVKFDVERDGLEVMSDLIQVCRQNGIDLIFVYSPEYNEMQSMTSNRTAIFKQFHELADSGGVPFWDYSNWKHASDQDFFQNSQHLNSIGAAVFSDDLANQLKTYLASRPATGGNVQDSGTRAITKAYQQ